MSSAVSVRQVLVSLVFVSISANFVWCLSCVQCKHKQCDNHERYNTITCSDQQHVCRTDFFNSKFHSRGCGYCWKNNTCGRLGSWTECCCDTDLCNTHTLTQQGAGRTDMLGTTNTVVVTQTSLNGYAKTAATLQLTSSNKTPTTVTDTSSSSTRTTTKQQQPISVQQRFHHRRNLTNERPQKDWNLPLKPTGVFRPVDSLTCKFNMDRFGNTIDLNRDISASCTEQLEITDDYRVVKHYSLHYAHKTKDYVCYESFREPLSGRGPQVRQRSCAPRLWCNKTAGGLDSCRPDVYTEHANGQQTLMSIVYCCCQTPNCNYRLTDRFRRSLPDKQGGLQSHATDISQTSTFFSLVLRIFVAAFVFVFSSVLRNC